MGGGAAGPTPRRGTTDGEAGRTGGRVVGAAGARRLRARAIGTGHAYPWYEPTTTTRARTAAPRGVHRAVQLPWLWHSGWPDTHPQRCRGDACAPALLLCPAFFFNRTAWPDLAWACGALPRQNGLGILCRRRTTVPPSACLPHALLYRSTCAVTIFTTCSLFFTPIIIPPPQRFGSSGESSKYAHNSVAKKSHPFQPKLPPS